ncbi:hypothetical protein HOY80DRAFT_1030340 [Tuber brumale]|nr:hypothetical protein HOY80DRAFT_1030340 [Tuber brumale]
MPTPDVKIAASHPLTIMYKLFGMCNPYRAQIGYCLRRLQTVWRYNAQRAYKKQNWWRQARHGHYDYHTLSFPDDEHAYYNGYWEDVSEIIQTEKDNVLITCALFDQYTKNMHLSRRFTLCGTIERIVFQARAEKKIPEGYYIQEGLNEIAHLPEFDNILSNEVRERGLVLKYVQLSIENLFQKVEKTPYQHSSPAIILVKKTDYNVNQYAALIALLKMQDKWILPLSWRGG